MAGVPHFALPFRFERAPGGTNRFEAAVVEQDTSDDVLACVIALAVTPLGHRLEEPGFGMPDLAFLNSDDVDEIVAAAITEWEPRGAVALVRSAVAANGDVAITAEVAARTDT